MSRKTTKAEREARRKLVYYRHFVRGRSALSISQDPDIRVDSATVDRDIKALKATGVSPDQDWIVKAMIALMDEADATTGDRLRILNSVSKIISKDTEADIDFDRWDIDTGNA